MKGEIRNSSWKMRMIGLIRKTQKASRAILGDLKTSVTLDLK